MKGVLAIGTEEKEKLAKLREYAKHNIFSLEQLRLRESPGDNPNHCVILPVDFRVVFSHEMQQHPLGLCRHLSVSVSREKRVPNEFSMEIIAQELGFRNNFRTVFNEYIRGGKEYTFDGIFGDPRIMLAGKALIWSEKFSHSGLAISFMEKVGN